MMRYPPDPGRGVVLDFDTRRRIDADTVLRPELSQAIRARRLAQGATVEQAAVWAFVLPESWAAAEAGLPVLVRDLTRIASRLVLDGDWPIGSGFPVWCRTRWRLAFGVAAPTSSTRREESA